MIPAPEEQRTPETVPEAAADSLMEVPCQTAQRELSE